MNAFMFVDLQDLLDMSDIDGSAGRDIAGSGDGGEPFGGADERQRVEGVESGV